MTHIRTLMDQMIQIDEGRMKDIFTADEEGQSAKQIAKALNLPLETVKKILGEESELKEFSTSQLDILAKSYASMSGKTIGIDQANKLRKIFDKIPDSALSALRKKKIPFISGLALSRMIRKGIPVTEVTEDADKEGEKKPEIKKETAPKDNVDSLKDQITILKTKLENEKNKAVKPEPNKETGEVPLTVGIAHKYIKDKKEKEEGKKEEVKEANDGDKRKDDPCWKGYKMVGMKDKGGKEVPNCVPMSKEELEEAGIKQEDVIHETLEEKNTDKYVWSDINKAMMSNGFSPGMIIKVLNSLRGKNLKEETLVEFTSQQIKQAYGIANDPRYKGGDYSGAVKAIEKLAKGLSQHPDVMKVLKKTNEDYSGAKETFERLYKTKKENKQ